MNIFFFGWGGKFKYTNIDLVPMVLLQNRSFWGWKKWNLAFLFTWILKHLLLAFQNSFPLFFKFIFINRANQQKKMAQKGQKNWELWFPRHINICTKFHKNPESEPTGGQLTWHGITQKWKSSNFEGVDLKDVDCSRPDNWKIGSFLMSWLTLGNPLNASLKVLCIHIFVWPIYEIRLS